MQGVGLGNGNVQCSGDGEKAGWQNVLLLTASVLGSVCFYFDFWTRPISILRSIAT